MVARPSVVRSVTWMAGTIVVLLAVAVPAIYFALGWQVQNTALRTEAEIYAHEVSGIIHSNPEMWTFEVIRIEGLLATRPEPPSPEFRRVLDRGGNVVAERAADLPWPAMIRSRRLMDAGANVGTLEVGRSLRPLVARTAFLAAMSAVLGAALFILLRVYPMSALRNALALLTQEKERAQVTLQSIGDGVITADSEGRVVLLNRVAEFLTGWPQAEAVGRPVEQVFRREGPDLVARDGSRCLIEVSGAPILDGDGRSFGDVIVFRDVTERARVEAEMLKAQKLESLGILAGGIAHEIRNPLSAVNISVSSIESVCEGSEGLEPDAKHKIRLIAEQMKSAAAKMATVVQRVMDFSKPAPPRMESVNLNGAVEEAIRLSSSTLRTRGIAILQELAADLPACRADLRLIEQVLVNLITNAYQAMERTEGPKRLEVASAARGGQVVITVADSGPGVPAAIRERIFDPFFTTRKEGSGIGLSFSHRIVAEHGGTLGVGTSRWGGAEFRIEIPGVQERSAT
ncbi:MAG: two-component system sensor histidine kinase NtrB [Gemmatimonadota bacterium]